MTRSFGQPPLHMARTSHAGKNEAASPPWPARRRPVRGCRAVRPAGVSRMFPSRCSGCDEVVALIEVAVVLDDRHVAAGRAEDAQRVAEPERRPRRFFEDLDDDPPHVVADPFVEDRAEKRAKGLGRHRPVAHAAGEPPCRSTSGMKLRYWRPDLLEEVIHLERGAARSARAPRRADPRESLCRRSSR